MLNIVNDGFTDTATTKRPALTTVIPHFLVVESKRLIRNPNSFISFKTLSANESLVANSTEVSTTTERYRISRKELGRILGKNGRGLQKLLRLELNDAANVSANVLTNH